MPQRANARRTKASVAALVLAALSLASAAVAAPGDAVRVLTPGALTPRAPQALCNTCPTAEPMSDPIPAWQYMEGETSAACLSDFYRVTLTAGTRYAFTLCDTQCPAASVTFDSRLVLRSDADCSVLRSNDDWCGLPSHIYYRAAADGPVVLEVTGYDGAAFGPYLLAYEEAPPPACGTCAVPKAVLDVRTDCQTVTDSNADCETYSTASSTEGGVWYEMPLLAGRRYEFSMCPNLGGSCGGTAAFDSRIDVWDDSCTNRLAGNDDSAGCSLIFRSYLQYWPTVSGIYKLQVRGFASDTGTYRLAYRDITGPCIAATVASTGPVFGPVAGNACATTQTFTIDMDAAGTPPYAGTWTITAPPGATASPASGAIVFSGTQGTFTSSLTRPDCDPLPFQVAVSTTNCSGTPADAAWTFDLEDRTPPRFLGCAPSMLLDCAAPDPPAPPSPSVADNCDPAPAVVFTETVIPGSCPGNHATRREWTATDCSGNSSRCLQNIVHRDTTPPVLTGADAWCLYPPNHEYYCLFTSEMALTTSDDCSPPVAITATGCTSSEPDMGTGPDDWPDDCIISPDGLEVCLRAERAGTVVDRTYAITGLAVDACGVRSAPRVIAIVTVPADDAADHSACRASDSGLDRHY